MTNMKKVISVGSVLLGGNNPIRIQSMTNTKTRNIDETVTQIHSLEKLGCEIIRVAVENMLDAKAIRQIKDQINIPLVADIHFDYMLAIEAIKSGADKIRINPGNIGDMDRVRQVVEKAKEYNVPIRVGVNSGSLEKELVIIGVSSRIEIWSKEKWDSYNEEQDSDDIAEKMTMLGI